MCSAQRLHTLGRESLHLGPIGLRMGIPLHSPQSWFPSPNSMLSGGRSRRCNRTWSCGRPTAGRRLAHLHQEPDPGPVLSVEREVDEGRDAHQVDAPGSDVAARNGNRLDGLVDGGSPDRVNLDPALTPENSGDSTGHQDRPGGASHLEHLPRHLAFLRHPSILVKYALGRGAGLDHLLICLLQEERAHVLVLGVSNGDESFVYGGWVHLIGQLEWASWQVVAMRTSPLPQMRQMDHP